MGSIQKDEITLLKSKFEGQIKIISDIGEFTNVVTFQPTDLDLQCKFQLLGMYITFFKSCSAVICPLSNTEVQIGRGIQLFPPTISLFLLK